MKSAAFLLLAFATATLLMLCCAPHITADTPKVVSAVCDPRGPIPQGSAFWGHLGSLLAQLVDNTPYTPTFSFKTRFGGGDAPAFGEAYCQASCAPAQCQACLRQLSNDIWGVCNNSLGARVEYPDCWIHYECFYF